jgi:hypothetical protein
MKLAVWNARRAWPIHTRRLGQEAQTTVSVFLNSKRLMMSAWGVKMDISKTNLEISHVCRARLECMQIGTWKM